VHRNPSILPDTTDHTSAGASRVESHRNEERRKSWLSSNEVQQQRGGAGCRDSSEAFDTERKRKVAGDGEGRGVGAGFHEIWGSLVGGIPILVILEVPDPEIGFRPL
jgi:hypothetical protein